MKDLFGQEIEEMSYILFHDESDCKKSNFLYHGFLFAKNNSVREILDKLIEQKKNNSCEGREIHFSKLNQHSRSPYGRKTKVALEWLNLGRKSLEDDKIKFYCFGVDKNNVKNFWLNPDNFEKNVYLRFFEIGLKSAIRWFNLDKISLTLLDEGKHDAGRQIRIKWLNQEFFENHLSHEIECTSIKLISSNEQESRSQFSNLLQLNDIFIGTTRSCFVELGKNQKGQKECVDNFIDVVRRFNNSKSAYRKGSKYYKKFCIQFFPSRSNLTKDEFLSIDIGNLLKKGHFYCDRLTYNQQVTERKQLKLCF